MLCPSDVQICMVKGNLPVEHRYDEKQKGYQEMNRTSDGFCGQSSAEERSGPFSRFILRTDMD